MKTIIFIFLGIIACFCMFLEISVYILRKTAIIQIRNNMEITLISVQLDTFNIDFQKVFDFMKNEGELENIVYDYSAEFGDNIHYYLEKVFGIKISIKDACDVTAEDKKIYSADLNEFTFDSLYDSYYDWLDKNKEKLGLTEE